MTDPEYTIRASRYTLLQSSQQCWKCDQNTPVIGFLVPAGHEELWIEDDPDLDEWERHDSASLVSNIARLAAAPLAHAQALSSHYGPRSTKTGGRYFLNSCAHCQAVQGDFFLYSEPDGAFFPTTADGLARIRVIRVDEPFACNGSPGYASFIDTLATGAG